MMIGKAEEARPSSILSKVGRELTTLHEYFRCFDCDSTETQPDFIITIVEFCKVLRCLGHSYSDELLESIFDEVDDDGSGELSFAEFADLLTARVSSQASELIVTRCNELKQLFGLFDADGGGALSQTELAHIMCRLGRKPGDEELQEAMGFGGAWQTWDEAVGSKIDTGSLDFPSLVAMLAGERTLAQRMLRKQIRDFRQAFELFDEDNSGSIGLSEFANTMLLLGHVAVPVLELEKKMGEFSFAEPGEINFMEFLTMMVSADPFVMKEIKSHIVGFREAFDLFDRDGGGNITTQEFMRCWRTMGFSASLDEVQEMLEAADNDGSGEMDFKEFVFMVTQATGEVVGNIQGQLNEMREVFSLFDPDGDGAISATEVGETLRSYAGLQLADGVIEALLIACDDDGNGELSFSEFACMMAISHRSDDFKLVPPSESATQLQVHRKQLQQLVGNGKDLVTRAMCDQIRTELKAVTGGRNPLEKPPLPLQVGREICGQMRIRTFGPFDRVVREQKDFSNNWWIVLQGSLTVWRRNYDNRTDEDDELMPDPELNRTEIAARVADRLGAIPSPSGQVPENVTYKGSLWERVRRALWKLCDELKRLVEKMPVLPGSECGKLDEVIGKLVGLASDTRSDLRMWLGMGAARMEHDQDDMRIDEELLTHGSLSVKQLYELYLLTDATRKQLLLRKFFLQLQTFECDRVPRIDLPLINSNGLKLERILADREIAYITTDAGSHITYCSSEYCKLTGYSSWELRGSNPRMLQGSKTSQDVVNSLRSYVAEPTNDKRILISNYTKDGTMFQNSLYMAPIFGADGEVEKWIAATVDATTVCSELKLKPILQAAIDISRQMSHVIKEALTHLAPIFGSEKWSRSRSDTQLIDDLSEGTGSKHPDREDELLGELVSLQTTGDLAVLKSEPSDSRSTIFAGKDGAVVVNFNRQAWLQAHAMEPITFLSRFPRFASMLPRELGLLATQMTTIKIERGMVLCESGQPVEHVWFVKDGMLEMRRKVKAEKTPEQLSEYLYREAWQNGFSSHEKQHRLQGFSIVGPGDVIEQARFVRDCWLADCDVLAITSGVELYMLPRSALPGLSDGTWKSVHNTAVHNQRQQQRKTISKANKVTGQTIAEMMTPPRRYDVDQDLGWTGYRLPFKLELEPPEPLRRPGTAPSLPVPKPLGRINLPVPKPRFGRRSLTPQSPDSRAQTPDAAVPVVKKRAKRGGRLRKPSTTQREAQSATAQEAEQHRMKMSVLPPVEGFDADLNSKLEDIPDDAWDTLMAEELSKLHSPERLSASMFPESNFDDVVSNNYARLTDLQKGLDSLERVLSQHSLSMDDTQPQA